MSVKDPKSGQWVTEDHEIAGPIAYIETTTKSHLNNENETRCFEIYIDDSEQQMEKIHKIQKLKYSGESLNTSEDYSRPWIVAQYLLKSYPVIIPYRDLIRFPSKPLRARRDHARFLVLIEVITVLHQFQWEKMEINGAEYIMADVEDYAISYDLASVILEQTIKQISPKAEDLALRIDEFLNKYKVTTFNRRQIAQFTKWDTKTVKKYLDECFEQGLIGIKSDGRGTA